MEKTIKLTKRETEVLILTAMGYSNPMIAEELVISVHTVKIHMESIFFKLNVHNKVQASVIALKNNLIDINSL